jgi:hypothetical protein
MATAMEQGRFRSIFRFGAQYQKSAGTNRAPVAAEKNTKTAVVGLRNLWRRVPSGVMSSGVETSLNVEREIS